MEYLGYGCLNFRLMILRKLLCVLAIPEISEVVWEYTSLVTSIQQAEEVYMERWEVWQENALLFPAYRFRYVNVDEEIRKHRHLLDNAIRMSIDNCVGKVY